MVFYGALVVGSDGGCGDWVLLAKAVEGVLGEGRASIDRELEELRYCFVVKEFGGYLGEARRWIAELERVVRLATSSIGAEGVLFSKEMRSFIADPLHHLAKKLFNYAHDLARGRIGVEEFRRVAEAAVRTSLRTNLRSIYEAWVFLGIVALMGGRGARIVFPEHNHVLFERSGRQRGGNIPPNLVLHMPGRGYVSFFVEAPRPVGWGDTRDLARSWRLYVALRPDILVYRGRVLDIVREGDPPIERPDAIIECKELEDWYLRVREVRGPLAREMTAEEWRNRWLRGLWAGLADVLGVSSPEEAYEKTRSRRGVRLTEPQIVELYVRVYRPSKAFLVSRKPVPAEVRRRLEDAGLIVVDGVEFSLERLRDVAVELEGFVGYRGGEEEVLRVPPDVAVMIDRLASELGLDREGVLRVLLRIGVERREILERYAREVRA